MVGAEFDRSPSLHDSHALPPPRPAPAFRGSAPWHALCSVSIVLDQQQVLLAPDSPRSKLPRCRFAGVALSLLLGLGGVAACASDAEIAAQSVASGGSCNVASCVAAPSVSEDTTVYDGVARPLPTVEVAVAPLSALCGAGCGVDAEGAAVFPESASACVAEPSEASGGEGGQPAGPSGCSIVRSEAGVEGICEERGTGEAGDPCIGQQGCAPGFACVGTDGAGQCRPYCCADPEACPEKTFCAARPLLDRAAETWDLPLEVPVCVEAHDCRLDEPYPCPAEQTCTCAAGTACTVVRGDGTTGCVAAPSPGGLEGEPCPCSPATLTGPGLICSQATQTCLALCVVGTDGASCGEGRRCQSSASLPEGFGVCTGLVTSSPEP